MDQLTKFSPLIASAARPPAPERLPEKIVAGAKSGKSDKLSPAEFIRQKNPRTGTERLVVLAKFLEEYRGQPEYSLAEINKVAKESKLKDIHGQYVTYATRQGLIRESGKGKYSLTLSGEDIVAGMPKAAAKT